MPTIERLIKQETQRQREGLNLIASENYASLAVRKPLASMLCGKYAEGYPGARYYSGNEFVDRIESLAIERAKSLFGADHANVQPLSGNPANLAAYLALAKPGDKILGMNLTHGGHLSHGHGVNFSAKIFCAASYGVREKDQRLDYDEILDIAKREKPQIIICGASAYPRQIDFVKFRRIANEVKAYLIADIAHIAGLVAAGLHPTPVGEAHVITSTTHKTLRGPRGGLILCDQDLAEKIDRSVFPGLQGGPHEESIAAKAVCFAEAAKPGFKKYITQVLRNAEVLAAALQEHGFDLVTGGTDTHLVLIDLRNKKIDGITAEKLLAQAGIYTNRNTIPFEPGSPQRPSGLRLGTPALTTRGMGESEIKNIAGWISDIVDSGSRAKTEKIRHGVKALAASFPIPE